LTYVSGLNGWDPKVLELFRADAVIAGVRGTVDGMATTDEWLAPSATGTIDASGHKVRGQLELGADAVIVHSATPTEHAPLR
jgi:predicted oxidoreductase